MYVRARARSLFLCLEQQHFWHIVKPHGIGIRPVDTGKGVHPCEANSFFLREPPQQ